MMNEKERPTERISLLGIPIDAITREQTMSRLLQMLRSGGQHHVMTPNNEMLVEASRNAHFREVLQKSDLNLPDSTGLLLMARWTGQHLPERVTGVDTVTALCRMLTEDHLVFLLGSAPGVAERAAKVLQKENPHLRITGTFAGNPESDATDIVERVNKAKPHLLLVAYGAPKQDFWIAAHLQAMPSVRVAMGVGGTFDFLAGTQKRAPAMFRKIGLEWAWRFIMEPQRVSRMWRAVVVFPWLVLLHGRQAP